MVLGFLAVAVAAPCEQVTFEFSGQPACVQLVLESLDAVRLTNTCQSPVLVDQRASKTAAGAVVAPGEDAVLAGVSAFTLGAEGSLHQVVAAPRCEAAPKK